MNEDVSLKIQDTLTRLLKSQQETARHVAEINEKLDRIAPAAKPDESSAYENPDFGL